MIKTHHLNELELTKRALKYIKCIEILWKKNHNLEKENSRLREMVKDYAVQCSSMRSQIKSMESERKEKDDELNRLYSSLTKTVRYA